MTRPVTVVQYWAGCPKAPNSKWQRFLAIIRKCREQGWRNYLVWSKIPENPALVEPFREVGCEVILQPRSRRNFDIRSVWRTYKLMRRLNCDIFHCHNDHTSPLIGSVLAGVPVRVWSKLAMSGHHEEGIVPSGWHRLMPSTRLSCLCAHRVLAISQEVRAELLSLGVPRQRVKVVHGAVDVTRFATAINGEIRQELGVNPSHVLISTVGCAIPRKGWDIAIKAFAKVQHLIPNVRLVLVGNTTSPKEARCFQQLTELTKKCKVSEYVHFVGHRSDFPAILKASDVFIFPSRSEGLPAALLEAMAAGLPCVTTNICGMTEVISHGEDGLLFESENVEELAGHIVRLIEDQTLRTRIASQALKRAGVFSMQAYVDKVFGCYKALLGVHVAKSQKRGVGSRS